MTAVVLELERVEDVAALKRYCGVEAAAYAHDFLALPADPLEEHLPALGEADLAGEVSLLTVASADGTPVGALRLGLRTVDNTSSASITLCVHPDHRGQGHGRALLRTGIDQAAERGRTRLFFEVPTDSEPAVRLMRQIGAKEALEDCRRLLDLRAHPPVETLLPPPGYRVVQWEDRSPDDLVDGIAYLVGRMVLDAPMGELDYEPEVWDRARYRAKEAAEVARQRRHLCTAVVHESGEVAGLTEISVNRHTPEVSYQWETIVEPSHRGQRLGLVLKTWNHRYLTDRVPGVVWVNTWNAASNTFMIGVNDALGFEVAERWSEYQLDLPG